MYAGDSVDWARRVCEAVLHVVGQTWYEGAGWLLQGIVGETPVYMLEGAYEGRTGEVPGCSKAVIP